MKVICLALLFSALWGFWWFNIDPNSSAGLSEDFVIYVWIKYLFVKKTSTVIIYTLVCFLAFMGFVTVAFIRPSFVRIPLMFVMLAGWAFELSILDLDGWVSNPDLLWILWHERATASGALVGYAPYIARDCAFVAILGIVLCAAPARRHSVSGIFGLLPIMSGASVAGVEAYTRGATEVFPIPFGTFFNTATVLITILNNPSFAGESASTPFSTLSRDAVTTGTLQVERSAHPIFSKIIMIMDESVRGDALSLNNSRQSTTPFLEAANNLVNFGVAISAGNCSFISRTIFRFGKRLSDLPDHWREGLNRPTIWQFAREAGYKTVHIDASDDNDLAPIERSLIDSNITIFEKPGYFRDQKLVGKILSALQDKEPAFIYVDKYGVHWPYSTKYPPDFRALPTPVELNASKQWNGVVGFVHTFLKRFALSREDEIARYPNAIAWSVDEFFRNLLPAVDLSNTLIIYTSDHGQSLSVNHITHCSTTAVSPGEAYVPLFASTAVSDFRHGLEKTAQRNFGRFSHFEVFPTLLLAMGYDKFWVSSTYGPSLTDAPSPDRRFMTGSPILHPMMIDPLFRLASPSDQN